jgi:hypothetical protein
LIFEIFVVGSLFSLGRERRLTTSRLEKALKQPFLSIAHERKTARSARNCLIG